MIGSLPKPEVIFAHESDLDGLVSGLLLQRLARKLFDSEVPLQAYHYHSWRQRTLKERAAWVCDLSFESRLDKLGWVVIDHHPTELQPKNALLVHHLNKSAGLLCYELCREHEIESPILDRLVHLNNVADLFLEDDPDFIIAGDYANLVKTYQFWNLHALIGGDLEKLLDHPLLEVMAIKRRIENPLGFAWSKDNIVEISSAVGFVDTVVGNNNLIVHQLLEQQATRYPVLLTLFRKSGGRELAGVFVGSPESAWDGASELSRQIHITYKERPFHTILSCAPTMYDELWTGGKAMYKLEPVLADGGELIIYAPHIAEVCVSHGTILEKIGYHCRDYFIKQWDRFQDYPWGVLAHSTHVYGLGTYENEIETPRARVSLATQLTPDKCQQINLGYRDPKSLRMEDYANREDEGILLVPKAGEMLYQLKNPPKWAGGG